MLVFWIMTLVKQFKSGQTLWGVLSIFFAILAPIWCFMNGHKSLGMKFIIAFVIYLVGFGLTMGGMATMPGVMPEMPEMPEMPAPQ